MHPDACLNPFKIRVPSKCRRFESESRKVVSIPSRSGYRQNNDVTKSTDGKVSIPSRSGYRQNVNIKNVDLTFVKSQSLQDQGTVKINAVDASKIAASQSLQDQGTVKISSIQRSNQNKGSQSLQDQGTVKMRNKLNNLSEFSLNPFKIRVPSK